MTRKVPPSNHTQSPNVFYDEWIKEINSLAELKVVEVVIRNTFGWHYDRVKMSLADIQEATGLSKSSCQEGVKRAVSDGYIARVSNGRSFAYEIAVDVPESGICQNDAIPELSTRSYREQVLQPPVSLRRLNKGKKQENPLRDPEPVPPPPFKGTPFLKAWQRFEEVQEENGKPIKPARRTSLYEQIEIVGEQSATAALREAASAGWPSIFPKGHQNGFGSNGSSKPDPAKCDPDRPMWMAGQRK